MLQLPEGYREIEEDEIPTAEDLAWNSISRKWERIGEAFLFTASLFASPIRDAFDYPPITKRPRTKPSRPRLSDPLFRLADGTDVYRGDILWHPDTDRVGWCCIAEFAPEGDTVTVRSRNGAVPTVLISELRSEPPKPPARCEKCGQILPENRS